MAQLDNENTNIQKENLDLEKQLNLMLLRSLV